MRYVITLLAVLLTSGCSTIGNLEVLNDMGSTAESVRVTAKSFDKTMSVLGVRPGRSRVSTSRINTGYGNAKSSYGYYKNKNLDITDAPYIVQEVQDIFRYIRW